MKRPGRGPTWPKHRKPLWQRVHVGDPVFFDLALQRAYWKAQHAFATLKARAYVECVFRAAMALEPPTPATGEE